MNILPKKSWHVRTKANIERVRRDEAKAAEEEKEKQRRIALAESEARTEALRVKSRKRKRDDEGEEDTQLEQPTATGHINFFQEEEEGIKKSGTNAEYEAEKKAEQEKQEKAIGLLTYLGQSAIEAQTSKPWYQTIPAKHKASTASKSQPIKEELDLKSKWSQDPMKQMGRFLHQKDKISERDKTKMSDVKSYRYRGEGNTATVSHTSGVISSVADQKRDSREGSVEDRGSTKKIKDKSAKKKKKKEKTKDKHKHKKKHKKHKNESQKSSSIPSTSLSKMATSSSGKSIQQLRAERLHREREEKRKTEQLLAKVRGEEPGKTTSEVPTNERERRYNSQFNPDFVRKKRRKFDVDDYC